MRVRKPLSLVTIIALVAGLMLAVGASPAAAADQLTSNQTSTTKMRCRANAPIVGAVDADQVVGLNVTYPKYVEQGATSTSSTISGDTDVPTEQSGITRHQPARHQDPDPLRRWLHDRRAPHGRPAPARTRPTPTSTPDRDPRRRDHHDRRRRARQHAHGRARSPAGILDAAAAAHHAARDRRPGHEDHARSSRGTIPADLAPPFADYGFAITPRVNAPVVGETDAAASCAPNYGALANGNGEPLGTQPLLTDTTIIPNTNPLVTITTPGDGDKYLPDAAVFADYACTETVYALVSCDATAPDGTQLDFSTFGQKTFTVTATDANGGVTTKTVTYDVGGNVAPIVDAGTDSDRQRRRARHPARLGDRPRHRSDPLVPVDADRRPGRHAEPDDANDPFEPNQRFVAPRGGPVDLDLPPPRRRRLRHR